MLSTKRIGGDFEIRMIDCHGQIHLVWFQLKKPYKKSYETIEKYFQAIKNKLEGQDEVL